MAKSNVMPLGLTYVFGEKGTGKTFFSLTCGSDPKKSVFIDGDSGKSRQLVNGLGWEYIDLLDETEGMDEIEFHRYVLDFVANLDDDLDVVVFDNAKEFFNSADSWFISGNNWKKYRKEIRGSGPIVGGIQWRTMREYHLPRFYSLLSKKAKLAIVITHEKPQSEGGVKTGAMEPAADDSLLTASNFVVRLTKNRSGNPAPVGLVIKNIGQIQNGRPIRILPPRVDPCTWEKIREYEKNPANTADLEPHEEPDEFEQHLIEGSLTPEQKRVFEFNKKMEMMKKSERMGEDVIAVYDPSGPPLPIQAGQIASSLEGQYPHITKKDVIRIVETAQESANGEESE